MARAWRDAPLDTAPSLGRVAALAQGGGAGAPAAAHAEARALYAAWVEDSAIAAVFDAPTDVVAELAAALDLPSLDGAPPAAPAELSPVSDEHAPVVWLRQRPDLELPAGALADVEATLRADLLEALRALFDALAPGMAVVAIRV